MKKLTVFSLVFALALSACKKDKDPDTNNGPSYTVPTTYSFSNVNFSGQTTRLDMLAEMTNLMKTGNTSGIAVDAQVLKNMFANSGNPFSDPALNSSGKQLKDECFLPDQPMFEVYMDSLAHASQSTTAGSAGVAGVVVSPSNPSTKYLFSANGVEYTQLIEKGLMGAVFFYQAMEAYLCTTCSNGVGNNVDNQTVTPGSGTTMEHHWDEGFGYLGAPIDFPTNLAAARYWAKYSNTVNQYLNSNTVLMDAFLKGRAAISNKDYTTRDQQITIIRSMWEKVSAATAIHYINEALANLSDDAIRNHVLSEAYAFISSLQYSSTKLITNQQLSDVKGYLGLNFYNVTISSLNNVKDLLSTIYGFDNFKDNL